MDQPGSQDICAPYYEARELISGLQDITKDAVSKRKQDRLMTTQIVTIDHHEILTIISQVCDHPTFSDVASCRIEALSVAPSISQDVFAWNDRIQQEENDSNWMERMEDWTIADYWQNYLDLLKDRSKNPVPYLASFLCGDCELSFTSRQEWAEHARRETRCQLCDVMFECHGKFTQHTCFCWSPGHTSLPPGHVFFCPAINCRHRPDGLQNGGISSTTSR